MKTQNLFDARMVMLVLFAASLMSFGWYSINAKKENIEPTEVEFLDESKIDVKVEVDPQVDPQVDLEVDISPLVAQETIAKTDSKIVKVPRLGLVEAAVDTTKEDEDDWRKMDRKPPMPPLPSIAPRVMNEWSEAFAEKFAKQFSDFYEEHKEEMEEMMAELQESMESADFEHIRDFKYAKEMALRNKEMALASSQEWRINEQQLREETERAIVLAKREMELQKHNMKLVKEEMAKVERELKVFEGKMKKFDEELKQELVKDGYIKPSESIKTLDVDRDGEFKVNGKKVTDKDSKRYGDIYKKYFDEDIKGLRYNNH